MPVEASQLPAFARQLASGEQAKEALESVHPDYSAHVDHWQLMIDAFEGTGGFADGDYLWPYRNELPDDYNKRQKMARYHNYVETIIDLYVQHVFTREPDRQTDNEDLREWWDDVDGHGTPMTDFLRQTVALALAAGHTGILMDSTTDAPVGPAKADQRSRPFLTRYLATSIVDWRTQDSEVIGIKLREAVPSGGIADPVPEGDEALQYLLWDEEGWARYNNNGELLDGGLPGLGLVPFEVLRPKPSILRPFMGRSLFSHGRIIQALYNRMSEEDEVLRNQAFSLLTISVGENGDVEAAKKQVGSEIGTSRALVSQGEAKYISPDMAVPAQVRENILQIIREMYRVAHMRYERDSLQAESAEAIRLQFKELNEMLQGLANELQRVEHQLAWFYFAWTQPTPEAAEAAYDAANVTIQYPQEFFLADLILDLEGWSQAIAMGLGVTMEKRLKKKAVRRLEPELQPEEAAKIDAEIDALPSQQEQAQQGALGAADSLRKGAQSRLSALMQTTSGAGDRNAIV
jgi:hypothetical protein